MNIAMLVFEATLKGHRRNNNSFDWNSNIGAYVVKDVLERSGRRVEFCDAATAHHYDIVLVSIHSPFAIYEFIKAVARLSTWRKRTFAVVAGGFGVQNIHPLGPWVDYAVFGRAEGMIADLVGDLALGHEPDYDNVMHLPKIRPIKMRQADSVYPYRIDCKPEPWQEHDIGCPRRCLFCNYTFARKHVTAQTGFGSGVRYSGYQELVFDRIFEDGERNKAVIQTAIDGSSERLRRAFAKPITNDMIVETIERLDREWPTKGVQLHLYNIGALPTESQADVDELYDVFRRPKVTNKRIFVSLQVTPFRPSCLTPAAYMPVEFDSGWYRRRGAAIVQTDTYDVYFTRYIESPWTHLLQVMAERAGEDTQEHIMTAIFSKTLAKLDVRRRFDVFTSTFDVSRYSRAYSPDERLPTWYLESYTPNAKVRDMARRLATVLGLKAGGDTDEHPGAQT